MRRSLNRSAIVLLLNVVAATSSKVASADSSQIQVTLTRYFIHVHRSIPLRSIGDVKSGDVLRLPEEAKLVSREVCFDLPPVAYRAVASAALDVSLSAAGELGAKWPAYKVLQFKADANGLVETKTSIQLDPLSTDEPKDGFYVLYRPKADARCDVVRHILDRTADRDILVSKVMHGSIYAKVSLAFSGSAEAEVSVPKLKRLLGDASIETKVKGSSIEVESARSPAPHSLAVQSALIDLEELVAIHLKVTAKSPYDLELLVKQYITAEDPGALKKIARETDIALREIGIRWIDAQKMYIDVFEGRKNPVPIEKASNDQMRSLATAAAALEIAATARR